MEPLSTDAAEFPVGNNDPRRSGNEAAHKSAGARVKGFRRVGIDRWFQRNRGRLRVNIRGFFALPHSVLDAGNSTDSRLGYSTRIGGFRVLLTVDQLIPGW